MDRKRFKDVESYKEIKGFIQMSISPLRI